ncbi:MAG: FKBP-type peptidyl-prolyl cis-trans isomerase [Planctomycetota bacterium]|jgi:FKBP-type peptidyl-prolyl cis-trans isomerase 2
MATARSGDTVAVNYTGSLDDGEVVATTVGFKPLQFTVGGSRIMPGVEKAVIGMRPGESKTTRIAADEAFGPYYEQMTRVVNRSRFPTGPEPRVGQRFEMTEKGGRATIVTVKEISGSKVTLDTNHPLAGKDLTFDIELMEIL